MPGNRHQEEDKFRKALAADIRMALGSGVFVAQEFVLRPAYDLLKREFYERNEEGHRLIRSQVIGRIDVLFRYRTRLYAGEIKFQPYEGHDFWDALKIIGYCSYYNWQIGLDPNREIAHPAILMPMNRIKLEHKIVSGQNEIALFGIVKNESCYHMKLIQRP